MFLNMPKVSVIVLIYEGKKYVKPVFDAILAQTHKDLEVIAVINGNADGSKELISQSYPLVKIIDPGRNTGFAEGNNLGIKASTGEFIQLVNQDLILDPNYIKEILKVFTDPKVAAATGKILRYDFSAEGGSASGGEKNKKTKIIDTTGILMSVTGRARDRGQLQIDQGQFDDQKEVFGVSGAAAMYRRLTFPFFDEYFFMYWEDVDLSWRLNNAGFTNVYVPQAVGYHGRTAGQAKGGYLHFWRFIKHHQTISPKIRQLNYKNHILMYIKNAPWWWFPAFFIREIAMFGYILVFEPSTLKVLPELFYQIPRALKQRKVARSNSRE